MRNLKHIPVMKNEAVEALNVRDNLNYVDATFGQGGYSDERLTKATCTLLASTILLDNLQSCAT